jgi:hypothetical protein
MTDLHPYLFLLCLIVFPAWWMFVLSMLGRMSGWRRLATQYETRTEPEGEKLRGQSMRLSSTSYNGAVNFVFAANGFYLAAWAIFRPGHPPLLIPWSDIRYVGPKKILWMTFDAFEIKANPPLTFHVLPKVSSRIRPYLSEGT